MRDKWEAERGWFRQAFSRLGPPGPIRALMRQGYFAPWCLVKRQGIVWCGNLLSVN